MYPTFDLSKLNLKPLAERKHDMHVSEVKELAAPSHGKCRPEGDRGPHRRRQERGAAVILMMGAHVIKTGMSRFIIDLMEKGLVTHVGFNGACAIHDFELAMIGATTESVARYISAGQFGLWQETGRINDIVKAGAEKGYGFGYALGKNIFEGDYPHKDVSILAAGYRLKVPVTVHTANG